MNQTDAVHHPPNILIIDLEEYWRGLAGKALLNDGLVVAEMQSYDPSEYRAIVQTRPPDLVVLGCTQIEADERELIKYIQSWHHHLLVLCLSLPWPTMRELFKLGIDDVTEKPYNPENIKKIVQETLHTVASREKQFVG